MEDPKKNNKKRTTINPMLRDIFGEQKSKLEGIDGIEIKSEYVDALKPFCDNNKHLGIVLEKAFEKINLKKLSDDYKKELEKNKSNNASEHDTEEEK